MPFIGNKPSAVPLTSADIADSIITSAKIVDATIANADIANSTINLTTKVTGTLPVANGGTGLAAIGTSLQVLRTNTGATALEYATVSSDVVLLATTDASASATISFDGYYSSTYKNYKVIFTDVYPATTNTFLKCRFRRSNADVTSANYKDSSASIYFDSATPTAAIGGDGNNNATSFFLTRWENSNSNLFPINGELNIFSPLGTTYYKRINSFATGIAPTYNWVAAQGVVTASLSDAVTALSGITFFFSSGNIATGNFKLYGIK